MNETTEDYLLGKIDGYHIYTKIKSTDVKTEVNLEDLPIRIKKEISKLKGKRRKFQLDNWIEPHPEFFIEREEYSRLLRLNNSILKHRSITDNSLYLNYLLQSYNLKELKELCKENTIKNFSNKKKQDLIEHIILNLSQEEIFEYIEENELRIISFEIGRALQIIHQKAKEKIEGIKIVNEKTHEIELYFSGFNWETETYLTINSETINNPERDCSCKFGLNMGFCQHFWVGFIKSLDLCHFQLSDWNLTMLPKTFEHMIKNIKF